MTKFWTCVTGVILIIATGANGTQTTDCNHQANTVAYYDNMRVLIGNVTEIHGNEITFVAKGKDQLAVRVLHVTEATTYDSRNVSKGTVHRIESTFLRANDGSLWAITYCYYCREIYGISKLEGL